MERPEEGRDGAGAERAADRVQPAPWLDEGTGLRAGLVGRSGFYAAVGRHDAEDGVRPVGKQQDGTRFAANAVRLQLHALAYNLANFLRTLALPDEVKHWSLTTLRDRLVKIGAKIVRHGRSIAFQMAELMVPRALFQQILAAIATLRPSPPPNRC